MTTDPPALGRDPFRAILQGVADGITVQAPDRRLVYANDAAARALGVDSAEELLRLPLAEVLRGFEVLAEDGSPFPLDQLPGTRALRGEERPEAVVRFRVRESAEERWALVKAR